MLQEGCWYGHDVTEKWMLCGDGAVTADGLALAISYLHGLLLIGDAFTRAVVNGLRARKGLAPWETTFVMRSIKRGNLICCEAMRQHIDIDKNLYHHATTSGAGMMILVTGGARSGKSRHAENL